MEATKIRSTSKYPTTIIVNGLNPLGMEMAKRLTENQGYVIILDTLDESSLSSIDTFENQPLLTVLDITAINTIENNLRRLDYVFFFNHNTSNFIKEISTQEFLQKSNYLDTVLDLTIKFKAKFLLSTSMRAHQLLIETSALSVTKEIDPIPKYSETETQRYAENLVTEYQTKLDLDSRIIRLGELLGKGLNESTDSMYMGLIVNALGNKPLEIQGDGLESNYYIHYIDAVRGLIHAMFSMNTRGNVYSLSIPEEISILSIAYKISDMEPNPADIKFIDYNSPLPPLRLYKPAPNLNVTGWKNKININRSLMQSIAYMKEIIDTNKQDIQNENDNEYEDIVPPSKNVHGALARLIAERKKQEKSRMGAIVLSNAELRRKLKGDQDLKSKVSKISFWLFENLKQYFGFLKNITVKEFIFSTILIIILGLIYIFLISPILNIGANIYYLNTDLQNIKESIKSKDYKNTSRKLSRSTENIKNIQNRLADINFIFSLTGQIPKYLNIQNSLKTNRDYLDGMYISFKAITPLYNYLNGHNYELVPKLANGNSLLDVKLIDDKTHMSEITNNEGSLHLGTEKVKLSNLDIINSLNVYPQNIIDLFTPVVSSLQSQVQTLLTLEKNYSYIPTLLGQKRKLTYLFIIQDSTRFTPSGGEFSGYILFSVENGLLTNIEVNTMDHINNKSLVLNTHELNELNLISTKSINNNNIKLTDLTVLKDKDLRSIITKRYFEKINTQKIDIISWTNLNNLKYLLQKYKVSIDETPIHPDNFISDIAQITNNDTNNSRRDRVIMQIYSNILVNMNKNADLVNFISLFSKHMSSNNLTFYTNDLELKSFFKKLDTSIANDYIDFGAISNGTPSLKAEKLTITGEIRIDKNGKTTKQIKITTNNTGTERSIWICLPSGSNNFMTEGFDNNFYSKNFSVSQVCNIFLAQAIGTYPLSFSTIGFDNKLNSIYNYSFILIKPIGINAEYELRFIFETAESIGSQTEPTIARINDFTFSSSTFNNNIHFNFFKNE